MSSTNTDRATQPPPDVAEILWAVRAVHEQLEEDEQLLAAQVVKETADALARVAAELCTEREHSAVLSGQLNTEIPRLVSERDAALARAEKAEAENAALRESVTKFHNFMLPSVQNTLQTAVNACMGDMRNAARDALKKGGVQ